MDDIIGNVTDAGVTAQPQDQTQPVSVPQDGIIGHIKDAGLQTSEEHYSTPGQQLGAVAEGAARGLIGPFAPAIEEATGLTTGSDIAARQKINPIKSGAAEAATFVGSLASGLGEASLAGQVTHLGEAAGSLADVGSRALALGPGIAGPLEKGAAAVTKIAVTGVKTGAEMAALAASDELSKMVENDPGQTIGSAAINIGLSGLIGGAGGATLGAVSPLWDKTKNVLGVGKLATDFMAETKAIQEAGDPLISATKELQGRMAESDNMWRTMSDTKPEVLAKAMPEATPQNAAKIDAQIQDISGQVESALASASKSIKTKGAVPYLSEDLRNFQEAITQPNATFADKFVAADKLKTTLQGYAKWAATEEGTAKGALGKALSQIIQPALEDTKVWGAAGDVQRVTNDAISNMIKATKDMRGQVTSKLLGETEVAPEKVQSLLNATNAGKASRKASVVGNYLDAMEKYADAINKVHLDNGLEPPITANLNPTPVLNHALNTPLSPGVTLARWANQRGRAAIGNAIGEGAAGAVGGGLGAVVGHPLVGAWMGEKVLAPIFSAIAKPLAETALDSVAAKATVDYLGNAIKGQRALEGGISGLFTRGAEVIGKDLIPDQESRDRLEKSLKYADNPSNAINVGNKIAHYLPSHGSAAAQTMAQASNYFAALKPKQTILNPLDSAPPVDKAAQTKYNRALDVAQQPLLVLKHAKEGTLLPQDVQTLNTLYPQLHSKMNQLITHELINNNANKVQIPYSQKVSLNMLMGGAPLDGTMTPQAAQAIMHSSVAQQAQQQQAKPHNKGATESSLKQINKVNALYQTPLQAREAQKRQ